MFNKLKQFKDLRNQAKQLQTLLSAEKVSAERSGYSLTMDGNLTVVAFTTPETIDAPTLHRVVPELVNDCVKKAQRIMATKLQSSGFKMPEM